MCFSFWLKTPPLHKTKNTEFSISPSLSSQQRVNSFYLVGWLFALWVYTLTVVSHRTNNGNSFYFVIQKMGRRKKNKQQHKKQQCFQNISLWYFFSLTDSIANSCFCSCECVFACMRASFYNFIQNLKVLLWSHAAANSTIKIFFLSLCMLSFYVVVLILFFSSLLSLPFPFLIVMNSFVLFSLY